jgi:hypothetical protein
MILAGLAADPGDPADSGRSTNDRIELVKRPLDVVVHNNVGELVTRGKLFLGNL